MAPTTADGRGEHGRIAIAGRAAAHVDVAAIGKYRSVGNVDTHLVAAERGAAEERQRQAGDVDVAAGGLQHVAAVTVEVADAHAGPGEHRAAEHVDVAAARHQAAVHHPHPAVAAPPTTPDPAALSGRDPPNASRAG